MLEVDNGMTTAEDRAHFSLWAGHAAPRLMFSAFGMILVVFGLASGQTIYVQHSLGSNINLAWGAVQLLFGVVMVGFALRSKRNTKP